MSLKQSVASVGSILMPIGLISIFIACIIDPEMGEKSFGVIINNEINDDLKQNIKRYPFHFASGVRDGVLGILGLIIKLKYPVALLDFYMILLLIPISDFVIVKYYDGTAMDGICHILGAIATFILILLLRSDNHTNKSNPEKLKPV